MRRHGSPKELEQLRMVAARLFELQRPTKEIAAAVGRDEQTVRAWRRAWGAAGVEALRAKSHPGPVPKLSPQQRQDVLTMLGHAPAEYGYDDAPLWTTTLVARLIYDSYGVEHHHDYVGELLHALGWSYQTPTKRARERDDEAVAAWRRRDWPGHLKKVGTTAPSS
jgi:transposase